MCTGKGQSAIEYLMSYGWMLLVVAVIGGAVFSLVQGQAIESVSGFSGTEVSINDFGMNSEDELALSMKNTAADRVRIKAVELEDPETGATTRVLSEKQIEVGDRKTVKVDGFERTSSSNKQDLRVIYGSGGIDDQVVEGTITGKLKAKNHVYLQNAVFNRSTNTLNITAQNTGNTEADVEYIINSDSNSFTGNLGTVSSGETTSFTLNTDETFPLQNVSLNVDGQYFSNSQKQLKCTPTEGLVGYWPFEEIQGDTAYDYSGEANHGELINSPTEKSVEDCRVGGCLGFDGSDDHVSISAESDFQFEDNENFSVSTWFRTNDSEDIQRIVSLQANSNVPAFWLRSSDDDSDGDNELQVYVRGNDGNTSRYRTEVESNEFADNSWHHVTWTWNGQNNKIKIFYDGRNSTIKNYIQEVGDIDAFDGKWYIGFEHDSNGGNGGNQVWDGKIDQVRVYNRSISQPEIKRFYQVRSEDWAVSSCKLTN